MVVKCKSCVEYQFFLGEITPMHNYGSETTVYSQLLVVRLHRDRDCSICVTHIARAERCHLCLPLSLNKKYQICTSKLQLTRVLKIILFVVEAATLDYLPFMVFRKKRCAPSCVECDVKIIWWGRSHLDASLPYWMEPLGLVHLGAWGRGYRF